MANVLEISGAYRVRLVAELDGGSNPREDQDCNLANVITPTQRQYVSIDEDGGPLQYGWDHFSVRPDSEKLFIRWARMVHGVKVVESRPEGGAWAFWYVMPEKLAEAGPEVTPEQIIAAEEVQYRAWAANDVWGIIIEKSVVWIPEDGQIEIGEGIPTRRTTWEHVDSCWGFIGREYAEAEARNQLAICVREAGK